MNPQIYEKATTIHGKVNTFKAKQAFYRKAVAHGMTCAQYREHLAYEAKKAKNREYMLSMPAWSGLPEFLTTIGIDPQTAIWVGAYSKMIEPRVTVDFATAHAAWRRTAAQLHPDRIDGDEEKIKRLNELWTKYKVLFPQTVEAPTVTTVAPPEKRAPRRKNAPTVTKPLTTRKTHVPLNLDRQGNPIGALKTSCRRFKIADAPMTTTDDEMPTCKICKATWESRHRDDAPTVVGMSAEQRRAIQEGMDACADPDFGKPHVVPTEYQQTITNPDTHFFTVNSSTGNSVFTPFCLLRAGKRAKVGDRYIKAATGTRPTCQACRDAIAARIVERNAELIAEDAKLEAERIANLPADWKERAERRVVAHKIFKGELPRPSLTIEEVERVEAASEKRKTHVANPTVRHRHKGIETFCGKSTTRLVWDPTNTTFENQQEYDECYNSKPLPVVVTNHPTCVTCQNMIMDDRLRRGLCLNEDCNQPSAPDSGYCAPCGRAVRLKNGRPEPEDLVPTVTETA